MNFTKLNESELLFILKMRNRPDIRVHMKNSGLISVSDHLRFCEGLKSATDKMYFALFLDNEMFGVVDFINIDYEAKSYEPGHYYFLDNLNSVATDKNLAYYASLAYRVLLGEFNLFYPHSRIKKTNASALIFAVMKLRFEIINEDEEYFYLTSNELKKDYKNIIAAHKDELNKKFILEFLK